VFPLTQNRCYPNSPSIGNEGNWGTVAVQSPSLPFFGVFDLVVSRSYSQEGHNRRCRSISLSWRSTARLNANGLSLSRSLRNCSFFWALTWGQANTRFKGVCASPYLRIILLPTRCFFSSFIVGRK